MLWNDGIQPAELPACGIRAGLVKWFLQLESFSWSDGLFALVRNDGTNRTFETFETLNRRSPKLNPELLPLFKNEENSKNDKSESHQIVPF